VLYFSPKEARVQFASMTPPDFLLKSIIEKQCLEDVAHAYARVRRIAKHRSKTTAASPTYEAV